MKNMKKLKHAVILVGLLFVCSISNAQFVGSGSQSDSTTISEIKKNAFRLSWSDQKVSVKGFIVEQFSEDYFWLQDNTGRIKVEISPEKMPTFKFDKNTELILFGAVCFPLFGRTYIEAKTINLAGKQR
jgi:uncharacterized protein YdeI (BOF family)